MNGRITPKCLLIDAYQNSRKHVQLMQSCRTSLNIRVCIDEVDVVTQDLFSLRAICCLLMTAVSNNTCGRVPDTSAFFNRLILVLIV